MVRPPATRSASRVLMPTAAKKNRQQAVARREVEVNFEVENKVDQRNNDTRYKPSAHWFGYTEISQKPHALRGQNADEIDHDADCER